MPTLSDMSLKARDKQHQKQIEAGIAGRLKGHSFESNLSRSINECSDSRWQPSEIKQGHLHTGEPAGLLISYILRHIGVANVKSLKAYWLGGLATSGQGDTILGVSGSKIRRSKSDVLVEFQHDDKIERVGVSIKTCFKSKPTNAQLFCSTALATCDLFRHNNIPVSEALETGLRMFCGDTGFRPIDTVETYMRERKSNSDRWFFEELPKESIRAIVDTFTNYQDEITKILFQRAYTDDPFPPQYVLHQRHIQSDSNLIPLAIFHIDELVSLSRRYGGFNLRQYQIRKGRFKNDPNIHSAPRFGCIQFQRLGNKQNATQLQFNLEAGYFYKITANEESDQ